MTLPIASPAACVKCASPLPEGSAFCNRCGAPQSPGAVAPEEKEQTLWVGRPSAKAKATPWVVYVVFAATMLWVIFGWLTDPSPAVKGALLGATALPGVWLAFKTLVLKLTTRYRLTNQRLFKEVGIFSKTISEIELMRVDDVSVKRTITDRLFGLGTVALVSSDKDEPRLELVGIDAPLDVKERIRECVQKRRKRSLNLEVI